INLIIRQTGSKTENPDFSVLKNDFIIQGKSNSISSSYINGQTSRIVENILTLFPKKTGEVTIPTITAGKEKTDPIIIKVLSQDDYNKLSPEEQSITKKPEQKIFLEKNISNTSAYVGEELIYTLKILIDPSTPLINGTVIPPQSDDIVFEQFGDVTKTFETKNNKQYNVFQYKFLIFPQKSGDITLTSPIFQGSIQDLEDNEDDLNSIDNFFSFNSLSSRMFKEKPINLRAQPTMLKILPVPDGADFIANKVEIDDTLNTKDVQIGEAITRTITIQAYGAKANLIPDLKFENSNDFKLYDGNSNGKNYADQHDIIGVKSKQVIFMPLTEGKLNMPTAKIKYFNPKTKKVHTVESKPLFINVLKPENTQEQSLPTSSQEQKNNTLEKEVQSNTSVQEKTNLNTVENKTPIHGNYMIFVYGIIAGFIISSLLLGIIMFIRSKGKTNQNSKTIDLSKIKEACKANNSKKIYDELLAFAKNKWSEEQISNLSQIEKHFISNDLHEQFQELNKSLYSNDKNDFDANKLWKTLKASKTTNNESISDTPIKMELYPKN
ncbi:MAG: BatD family protein, partial [Alphaproteobacteria bacterium]|nr:BatD family protein [Alphaproteobacteria bacterium]